MALDVVQVHLGVDEEGIDELNHLFEAFNSPKFVQRVFEVYVFGVNAVGLVFGKPLVVLFEDVEDVHRSMRPRGMSAIAPIGR